jgi:hypothetical protein
VRESKHINYEGRVYSTESKSLIEIDKLTTQSYGFKTKSSEPREKMTVVLLCCISLSESNYDYFTVTTNDASALNATLSDMRCFGNPNCALHNFSAMYECTTGLYTPSPIVCDVEGNVISLVSTELGCATKYFNQDLESNHLSG